MRKYLSYICVVIILLFSTVAFAADQYELKKMKIIGNDKVKDETILQYLPFKIGDKFSKEEMEEKVALAKKILKSESLFYGVNIFPFFSEDEMSCKVLIEINGEWTYQFGFGIQPLAIMVEDRAFLGYSNSLGVNLSTLKQKVYFEDRQMFNIPLDMGIELYNNSQQTYTIYGMDKKYYAKKGYGVSLPVAYTLDDKQTVEMGIGFAQDRFGTNLEDEDLENELSFYTQNHIDLGLGYSYNSNNDYILTVNGTLVKVLDSDLTYGNGVLDFRYYQDLGKVLKGAVKVECGMATDNTPYYKLFNLNNLKGIRGKQGVDVGTRKFLIKGELSYPTVYGVEGVIFADMGKTWNSEQTFSIEDLAFGYGLGLRYRAGMPINTTFRIEIAFSENGYNAYFTAGESF